MLYDGGSAGAPIQAAREGAFRPGDVLAGRFRIAALLGTGAVGEVYAAEDLELGEPVAIKVLRPEVARDPGVLERFKREVHLARRVTHPNVCRVFDLSYHRQERGRRADDATGVAFVTMELLRGETLAERLARTGRMNAAEALPLVRGMAEGLAAAHRAGVVHRDFKSANVMLVADPEGLRVVVTDFGLARVSDHGIDDVAALTSAGAVLGSPAYMAPEQVRGETATPATDLYALGVVMYEMATGTLPFSGGTAFETAVRRLHESPPAPRSRVPDLDPCWEAAILRCLETDPAERFASAGEVPRAMAGSAPATGRPRRRLAAALAAAGLLLLLTGLVAALRSPRFGPAGQRAAAVERLYTEGLSRLRRFDAATARGLLERAVAAAPDDPQLHSALAATCSALGDDRRALQEAWTAFQLAHDLPLLKRRAIEAGYFAAARDWAAAAAIYEELGRQLPGDLEHGLEHAAVLIESGQGRAASAVLDRLRRLPAPRGSDPRIDLAEARAAGVSGDFLGQRAAAARVLEAAGRDAPLLVAEARMLEGRALRGLAESDRALDAFRDALTRFRSASARAGEARALHAMASLAFARGEAGEAQRLITTALATYRDLGIRRGEALALRDLGLLSFARGDFLAARATLEDALAIASEAEDKVVLIGILGALGSLLRQQGDFAAAQGRYEAALAVAREIGNADEESRLLNDLTVILQIKGEFAAVERRLGEALATFRRLGRRQMEAGALSNLGIALAAQGRLREARARQDQAMAIYRELADARGIPETLQRSAELDRLEDRLAAAQAKHEEALRLRRALGDGLRVAMSELALAELALAERRHGEAERRAREAAATFGAAGARDVEALALAVHAGALGGRGDRAGARAAMRRAAALARDSEDATVRLAVAIHAAELDAGAGRPGDGARALAAALSDAKAAGLPLDLEARLALGRLEIAAGDVTAGRERLAVLAREAARRGFALVAREATLALRASAS